VGPLYVIGELSTKIRYIQISNTFNSYPTIIAISVFVPLLQMTELSHLVFSEQKKNSRAHLEKEIS
jgi:hypothetical protein